MSRLRVSMLLWWGVKHVPVGSTRTVGSLEGLQRWACGCGRGTISNVGCWCGALREAGVPSVLSSIVTLTISETRTFLELHANPHAPS